jgi:hypothetical protein
VAGDTATGSGVSSQYEYIIWIWERQSKCRREQMIGVSRFVPLFALLLRDFAALNSALLTRSALPHEHLQDRLIKAWVQSAQTLFICSKHHAVRPYTVVLARAGQEGGWCHRMLGFGFLSSFAKRPSYLSTPNHYLKITHRKKLKVHQHFRFLG